MPFPAQAASFFLYLWKLSPWQGQRPWAVSSALCLAQLAHRKHPLQAHSSLGFHLCDTQGLQGLSCGFLGQFSSCCKGDKLSHNKLSHLGYIRLTDDQHLFYNINYLY